MITRNRIKTVLTIAAVAILALAIGQVQAAAVTVPNGVFQLYKPGTNYTVTATYVGDTFARGVGDNLSLHGADATADYSDGTTGTSVDCPGWTGPIESQGSPTGTTDLWSGGIDDDGTTCFNAFGTWSSQNGTLIESAESLGAIAGSSAYTVSAMINGSAGPFTLELRAGGVPMTPSSSVNPITSDSGTTGWEVISTTYDAAATAAYVGEPITIVMGTERPGEGDPNLYGARSRLDNVTLHVVSTDANLPDVDAGIDMITWSGQAVTMDANVVNNDTNEPQGSLTYLWTAEPNGIGDPNLDVAITDADTEDATVTITKTAPTGDATVVTMTLAVTLEGKDPVTDTMTIDVYDDACLAAKAVGPVEIDATDLDENCITNFGDFAVMAITWFDDYTLTEPVPK